jgi:glycosyltransferase involved in cell wall biosynthesis
MSSQIVQVCINPSPDGSITYMCAVANCISALGLDQVLIIHKKMAPWVKEKLIPSGSIQIKTIEKEVDVTLLLPSNHRLNVMLQGNLSEQTLAYIQAHHFLSVFAHNSAYEVIPKRYHYAHVLVPVSRFVKEALQQKGFQNVTQTIPYGWIKTTTPTSGSPKINPGQIVDWHPHKIRDQLLGSFEKIGCYQATPKNPHHQDSPIKIGIVSRLARAKRFPELLQSLSDALEAHPQISLHIFGSGPYQEIQAIVQATATIRTQTFFWGWQKDSSCAYQSIHYLLTGRPENEAMGLNIIEAQAHGVPILAIDGGPFRELIAHGKNGWLYSDPSEDQAQAFYTLLNNLCEQTLPLQLADIRVGTFESDFFSPEKFNQRIQVCLSEINTHYFTHENTHSQA